MPALESAWKEMEASNGPRDTTRLTARAFDEAQVGGERTYIGAHANLTVAHEHLDALIALLASHGASPRVPFNLLRPIMETSFKALWVLEPVDGLVRRQHGLRLEVEDYRQRLNWLKEYEKDPAISQQIGQVIARSRAETERKYRDEAQALSMTWDQARCGPNITKDLGDLDVVQALGTSGPPHLQATWRSLSGFQHGHSYALLAHSTITTEVSIPGGSLVHVTISDEALEGQGMLCCYLMLSSARRVSPVGVADPWNCDGSRDGVADLVVGQAACQAQELAAAGVRSRLQRTRRGRCGAQAGPMVQPTAHHHRP